MANKIVEEAWDDARGNIFPSRGGSFGAPPVLDAETRQLLSVASLDELRHSVEQYKAEAMEARRLLAGVGAQ